MLSDKQQAVFDFIIKYKAENDGLSPSIREINAHFQGKSNSTSYMAWILRRLQDHGLIHFEAGQARTIQVIGGKWIYKKDDEADYQDFLAWYEENETWIECCNGEREALYGAWQAGAGEWHEYDGPEEDEG